MKTIIFFLLVGTIVLSACNNSKTPKAPIIDPIGPPQLPYIIDLEKNLHNIKSIPLTQIGKEIEYIALETKPNCLLQKVNRIEFSSNYIFVCDYQKLLQFDRTGKFIRQVGAIGRGPGEYISIPNFSIDENKKRIYILGWGINKILVFDFNGKYLRSFSQSFDSFQFLINEQNNFAFYIPNGPQSIDSENSLIILDSAGNTLSKLKNYHRHTGKGLVVLNIPMFYFKNNIRLLEPGVDTLKNLKNDILEAYAIFNLGKMRMEPHPHLPFTNPEQGEALNRLKEKLWITNVCENKPYIFLKLDFGLSDSSTYCLFNKQTLETTHLENDGFKNDMDGKISFWPKYIFNDSVLIDYKDAFELLNFIRKTQSIAKNDSNNNTPDQFKTMIGKLTETSNPVLIVIK